MTKTINLSLPAELLKKIDRQVKSELRTRSDFFRETARVYLAREEKWRALQRQVSARAKAIGIRTEEDVDRVIQEFRREERSKNSKR